MAICAIPDEGDGLTFLRETLIRLQSHSLSSKFLSAILWICCYVKNIFVMMHTIVFTSFLLIHFNASFVQMFCSLLLNEYGKVCFAFQLQKTNIIDTNIIPKIFDNSKRKFLHNMCTHNPSNKSLHQLWLNGYCIWRHKNSVWHFNFVVKLSNFIISQHSICFIIEGTYKNKTHNWHTGLT